MYFDRLGRALAFASLLVLFVVPGSDAKDAVPPFDGERAMELLVAQCDLGSRSMGTPGNRKLQEMIEETASAAGLSVRRHCFQTTDPITRQSVQACNLIVSTSGMEPRLWVGAHFDSRPVSDQDPDPALRSQPLVGANDGASGTAVLLHLIEILGRNQPAQGVDLFFFDAEDSGHSGSAGEFCLGSQALVATREDFSSAMPSGSTRGLILLDMIGKRGLRIPQEAYSMRYAPQWVEEVFARAEELGLPAFERSPGPPVFDDHIPFLKAGIPAVDLIDFDFPEWHTSGDTPETCAPESLEQVGRLLVDLIYRP